MQSLWGPGAPTVKAITLRAGILKKFAREQEHSAGASTTAPISKNKGGLLTPQGSPKARSKRSINSDGKMSPPRRAPKKQARKIVKYSEPLIQDSNDEEWAEVSKNPDADEYKAWNHEKGTDGSRMALKKEVDEEKEDKFVGQEDDTILKEENALREPFEEKKPVVKTEAIV